MRRRDFPSPQRSVYWFVWYGNSKGKVSLAQNKGLARCSQLILKHIQCIWIKSHRLCWEFSLNGILSGFVLKLKFLKHNLRINRSLLSYCLCCLAMWERWSYTEYSWAWFGQDGCWNNCWSWPTAKNCLQLESSSLLSFGGDSSSQTCSGLGWGVKRGRDCADSSPLDLALFLQPANVFTLRNGFALQRPLQNANTSAETLAIHLRSICWLEELLTVSSAIVKRRS